VPTDIQRDAVFSQAQVDGIAFLPALRGIYCVVNRVNGRRYVGQSNNIQKRCLAHRAELRRGDCSNELMRRDVVLHGAGAFFFFALRLDAIANVDRRLHLNNIEIWFGVQLCSIDERVGYNLELGSHPTTATRIRNQETKLMRRNSGKYALLPNVNLYDPIHPRILETWGPGR
jgi:hypothetical protein